jgi:hypothetical protein
VGGKLEELKRIEIIRIGRENIIKIVGRKEMYGIICIGR